MSAAVLIESTGGGCDHRVGMQGGSIASSLLAAYTGLSQTGHSRPDLGIENGTAEAVDVSSPSRHSNEFPG